jgi:flavin-dependent dehydrogenase
VADGAGVTSAAPADPAPDIKVDVAVVGGGPAGAAVAVGCARAGLDCLLLDAGAAGRAGETLHPGVDVLLRDLGAAEAVSAAGFLRHEGHWVEWGGPAVFQAFGSDGDGPWRGYQAGRDVLDPLLVDAAERAGAHVRRGCRAVSAVVAGTPLGGGRVTGLITTAGTVSARTVVDAGGRRHWLDRQLGRSVRRVSPPLVVAYGHVMGTPLDAPRFRAGTDGWTWSAPVAADTSAWMRLSLRRDAAGWGDLPEEVDGASPLRSARGADVTWRCAEQAAGPGWFLVGDAATVVDPGASHGVLRALMSGSVAARAIVDRAAGRLTEERATAGYTRWIRDWFRHDVRRMHGLYGVFPSWPDRLGIGRAFA